MSKIFIVTDWLDGEHYFSTQEKADKFIEAEKQFLTECGCTMVAHPTNSDAIISRELMSSSSPGSSNGRARIEQRIEEADIKDIPMDLDDPYKPREYEGKILKPVIEN